MPRSRIRPLVGQLQSYGVRITAYKSWEIEYVVTVSSFVLFAVVGAVVCRPHTYSNIPAMLIRIQEDAHYEKLRFWAVRVVTRVHQMEFGVVQ